MKRKHINVYGPARSGKSRNALALAKHYGIEVVVDDDNALADGLQTRNLGKHWRRHLFLTHEPLDQYRDIQVISIEDALADLRGEELKP